MVKFYCHKEKKRFSLAELKLRCWNCEFLLCKTYPIVQRRFDLEAYQAAQALNFLCRNCEEKKKKGG